MSYNAFSGFTSGQTQNFINNVKAQTTTAAKGKWWEIALQAVKEIGLPALAILKDRQIVQTQNDLLDPAKADAIGTMFAADPAAYQILKDLAAQKGATIPEKPERSAIIDFTSPVTYVVGLLILVVLYMLWQNNKPAVATKKRR